MMRRPEMMAAALTLTTLLQFGTAQAADGKQVFQKNCVACHGPEGQGTAGLAPALKGNGFVTAKREDVLATVQDGRSGANKHYKQFPAAMPAWKGVLSDADIQAVVDYIRGDLQKGK